MDAGKMPFPVAAGLGKPAGQNKSNGDGA